MEKICRVLLRGKVSLNNWKRRKLRKRNKERKKQKKSKTHAVEM